MTRSDFEELQVKLKASGMALKSFLKTEGVPYSTFNYWSRKFRDESRPLPMAPIELLPREAGMREAVSLSGVEVPGVTVSFPNGVRAHFGRGSEGALMDVLSKSMGHVQPQ